MSEEQTLTVQELRRIVRLLERIHRLAEESSRRGMMRDGHAYLIQQYHAIVATLAQHGRGLPDYFPPLGEEATLGMVGFASAQVAEYLMESIEAEEATSEESASSGTGHSIFEKFFNSGEFQHIGEAMRGAMPDWMRAASGHRAGVSATSAEPHVSPAPGTESPESGTTGEMNVDVNLDLDVNADSGPQQELAALELRVRDIAAQMQRQGLPPEELQGLAGELAELGQQQSRLAREVAARSR